MGIIKIQNLSLSYSGEVYIDKFNLSVKKGEKIALTGKSGSGKTSLLNLLAGFIKEFKGEIEIFDLELNKKNISEIRKNTAWLPQNTNFNFENNKDMLLAPFKFGLNKKAMSSNERISEVMKNLFLDEDILKKKSSEISGGQRQRILLASAILLNKPLLLLDEPTSALDENTKKGITDYILSQKEITIIAATHDLYWIQQSNWKIILS